MKKLIHDHTTLHDYLLVYITDRSIFPGHAEEVIQIVSTIPGLDLKLKKPWGETREDHLKLAIRSCHIVVLAWMQNNAPDHFALPLWELND